MFWAHEQSCNDFFTDSEGYSINPVFEQSRRWLLTSNNLARDLGSNATFSSIIEPIHEIAIMKILHKRYPRIAKFQTSCELSEKPKGDGRWCENCSKCGRIYMFLLAHGINPKTVGFKHDLTRQKYHHLYALFASNRVREFG